MFPLCYIKEHINELILYLILFQMEKNIWNETKSLFVYLFAFIQFKIILFFNLT